MPRYPIFLSDLAEDDRKHIKQCIKMLLPRLRSCESRLQIYEAENPDPQHRSSQTVFKLLEELKEAWVMIDEMKNEVVGKHGLPDDVKQISEGFRRDFRNLLFGIPLE